MNNEQQIIQALFLQQSQDQNCRTSLNKLRQFSRNISVCKQTLIPNPVNRYHNSFMIEQKASLSNSRNAILQKINNPSFIHSQNSTINPTIRQIVPYRYRNRKPSLSFKQTRSSQYYADRNQRKDIPDNSKQSLRIRSMHMEKSTGRKGHLNTKTRTEQKIKHKVKKKESSIQSDKTHSLHPDGVLHRGSHYNIDNDNLRYQTLQCQSSKKKKPKQSHSSVSTLRMISLLRDKTRETESQLAKYKFFDKPKFVVAIKPTSKMTRLIKCQNSMLL